jgi:hypothetical protein
MATLKAQIANICEQLEVTVEGGLIPQVKAAAEACGLEYTTLKDTAAALVQEVLGEATDAPGAAAADDGDGDGDGDAVLMKVQSPEQRATESRAKAEREGRVQEIDDEDEPVPPKKKAKKAAKGATSFDFEPPSSGKNEKKKPAGLAGVPATVRRKSVAPCCCDALAGNYSNTSKCKATAHSCICVTRGPDKCRSDGLHPCHCGNLVDNYKQASKCKAAEHNCICSKKPGQCRAPAGTCECSCSRGFGVDCRFTGAHPCSCKVLKSNYKSNSYCKATHSHHCFCVEGKPDICREH